MARSKLNIKNLTELLINFEELAKEFSLNLPSYSSVIYGRLKNGQPTELPCGFRDNHFEYHPGNLRFTPILAKRIYQSDEFSVYTYGLTSPENTSIDLKGMEAASQINDELRKRGYSVEDTRFYRPEATTN